MGSSYLRNHHLSQGSKRQRGCRSCKATSPKKHHPPCLHFYYSQDLPLYLSHLYAKGKISNVLQITGPAPQVFHAEAQVPSQPLYEEEGASQSCCSDDKEPSIYYLQVQRKTPASPRGLLLPVAPKSSHLSHHQSRMLRRVTVWRGRTGTPTDPPSSAISSAEPPRGSESW